MAFHHFASRKLRLHVAFTNGLYLMQQHKQAVGTQPMEPSRRSERGVAHALAEGTHLPSSMLQLPLLRHPGAQDFEIGVA